MLSLSHSQCLYFVNLLTNDDGEYIVGLCNGW